MLVGLLSKTNANARGTTTHIATIAFSLTVQGPELQPWVDAESAFDPTNSDPNLIFRNGAVISGGFDFDILDYSKDDKKLHDIVIEEAIKSFRAFVSSPIIAPNQPAITYPSIPGLELLRENILVSP